MLNIKVGSWVQRKDGSLCEGKRVWKVRQVTRDRAWPDLDLTRWYALDDLELATPHQHADLIVQWAMGAEIEFLSHHSGEWEYIQRPGWQPTVEYRLKEVTPVTDASESLTKEDVTQIVNDIQERIDKLKKYYEI